MAFYVSKILVSLVISVSVVTSQEIPAASSIHRDSKFLFPPFQYVFNFSSSFIFNILVWFYFYLSFLFCSFRSLDNRVGGFIQDLSGSSSKSYIWRGFRFCKFPSFLFSRKSRRKFFLLN